MTIYTREEANAAAAYIQALHAATAKTWGAVLASTSQMHPGERQRRRDAYESQVKAFNEKWGAR